MHDGFGYYRDLNPFTASGTGCIDVGATSVVWRTPLAVASIQHLSLLAYSCLYPPLQNQRAGPVAVTVGASATNE